MLARRFRRSGSRLRSSNSLIARHLLPLAAAALVGLVAACGAQVREPVPTGPRIVRLVALNFGYEPTRIEVRRGETVRFIVENQTDLPHEVFIGSPDDQAGHAQAHQAAGPSVVKLEDEGPAALSIPPNGTGQLESTFDDPAVTVIGCHLAGHWESGMRAEIAFVP